MNLFKQHRAVIMRVFWFGVGGVLSILFNAGLFGFLTAGLFLGRHLLIAGLHINRYLAYGSSLAAVNVLLFVWNYFVGFRTTSHWTVAARRQAVCIGSSNLLNYAFEVILQGIFPQWQSAVIAAVQIFIAGFKFVLYHYWVYPAPEISSATDSAASGLQSPLSPDGAYSTAAGQPPGERF
jgi:hypothetical protein